jgi:hypothetical protein
MAVKCNRRWRAALLGVEGPGLQLFYYLQSSTTLYMYNHRCWHLLIFDTSTWRKPLSGRTPHANYWRLDHGGQYSNLNYVSWINDWKLTIDKWTGIRKMGWVALRIFFSVVETASRCAGSHLSPSPSPSPSLCLFTLYLSIYPPICRYKARVKFKNLLR